MQKFNLVREKWIPVKRANGDTDLITPFEMTLQHDTNPIVAFAWPRPDFDLASHEFLIGLLAAIYPADAHEPKHWTRFFHQPPNQDELAAPFEPFADAVVLDGDGPRFLQDFDALEGDELSVEALFIEAPGANTIKLNKDLFIKRRQRRVLSRAAAAMALYTLQQFAPSGGAGHRTSLRGGGPLVTLALPGGGSESSPTLWQRLWLNTPADLRLDSLDKPRAFPWLTRTRTSAKTVVSHEADAHQLQAFFGMPRRIRLAFADNVNNLPCDLTGAVDDVVCTGFFAAPRGVNYGIWRHPMTPYYRSKANSDDTASPVHAPEGRLGYRQWLGLVYKNNEETQLPAAALLNAKSRLLSLGGYWKDNSRLLAGGYAMDKSKALAFTETEMPLHCLDPGPAVTIEAFANLMVDEASVAVSILGIALRRALFGHKAEVKPDKSILNVPRERLWDMTEDDFHITLNAATTALVDNPEGDNEERLARAWRMILRRAALSIFDDTVPLESFDELEPEDIVEGRKFIFLSLQREGKLGKEFFKAFRLDPPETSRKAGRGSKGKSEEEIVQ